MGDQKESSLESLAAAVKLEAPKRFKLLSWNIDGLDRRQETLVTRTQAIVDVIKRYLEMPYHMVIKYLLFIF